MPIWDRRSSLGRGIDRSAPSAAKARETAQNAGIAAVTAGERELGEELGNPLIENRAVVAAGLVTQGTSKPRFAHAGRPAQNQIVVRVDPLAIGELVEQSAVEAAWGPLRCAPAQDRRGRR